MSERRYVFLPFQDQLKDIKGQFGEMIEAVREKLELCFTHFSLWGLLSQFKLISLCPIFLSLILSSLIVQSFLGNMQILIYIFRLQFSEMLFQIAQARFSCIDTFEKRVIYMFLFFDKLLLFDEGRCNILKECGKKILLEVVSVKIRDISIVPKQFQLCQLLIKINIISKDP